ncbi:hypothetical protein TNCV_2688791 [Trichonephila clavipes]|nr:hypothetical protein TNCV_2688791 [Trichonephila clavipes]
MVPALSSNCHVSRADLSFGCLGVRKSPDKLRLNRIQEPLFGSDIAKGIRRSSGPRARNELIPAQLSSEVELFLHYVCREYTDDIRQRVNPFPHN